MADKLSESAWTGFTKKLKLELDDGPLVKALSRLDKTDDAALDRRKTALEELVDQIKKQAATQAKRKKELGDKLFGEVRDKLDELMGLVEKSIKEIEAKSKTDGDDEDDSSPALLTAKMIPLLRELRKGETTMPALICIAGKNTVFLISRRAIAPARRKMLAEAADAKGGAKYIVGECCYENKALTFIVQSPAAGLAKRLRQAVLDQTEMRLKVVVRGDDGEDHDGEEDAQSVAAEGAPPPAPAQGAAPQATPAPEPDAAQAAAYAARRRQLEEGLQAALRSQHPESTKLRAVSGFADEKAKAHDYAGAHKALEMLEKLLATPVTPPGMAPAAPAAPAAASHAPDPAVAFNERLKALLPRLRDAAGTPQGDQAKVKAAEAGVAARGQDFEQGHMRLDEAEALLSGRGLDPAHVPPGTEDAGRAIVERLKALLPRLKDVAGTPVGEQVRLLASQAGVLARDKSFEQATALLDQAEHLLGGGDDAFRERWVAARGDLAEAVERTVAQLEALARVLMATEDENLVWVAEDGIGQVAGLLRTGLGAVDRATSKSAAQLAVKAAPVIASMRNSLQDPRLKACDSNEFGVEVAVAATVGKALSTLETLLDQAPKS